MQPSMSGKVSKPKAWGRDVPVEDPGLLRDVFRLLRETQREFPIKVEGTSTLPYTSVVKDVDFEKGVVRLKLVRPLPHELMEGAEFRATLALEDQRFEALMFFRGRDEYLTYRFSVPPNLFYADRRQEKRYPFRPRESAYVMAQDGGIPGYGVAGPLINISSGGLAMRVDRVIKLDDGMRVPAANAPLERGKTFARIRIQDLPRLPMLELAGAITHYGEGGGGLILGFTFHRMTDAARAALKDCFALRDQVLRKSPGGIREALQALPASRAVPEDRIGAPSATRGGAVPGAEAPAPSLPVATGPDPLALLGRRSVRLALVVGDAGMRERLLGGLREQGFHRVEVLASLAEGVARWKGPEPPAALLVDLGLAASANPAAGLRLIERQAEGAGEVPLVVFAEALDDGSLMTLAPRTRVLEAPAAGAPPDEAWGSTIACSAGLLE